jgi:hypothetical protein
MKDRRPRAEPEEGAGGRRGGLSAAQRRVLEALEACRREGRISPTVRELAAACGGISTATVAAALTALEERGFISRPVGGAKRTARGILLSTTPRTSRAGDQVVVPILPAAAGDSFWRGAPEGNLLLDRRRVPGGTLAAVLLPRRDGAPLPAGAPARSNPSTYLVLERVPAADGEAGAFLGAGGIWAGTRYTAGAWHRFFDLFTGAETVLVPGGAGQFIGRVAAVLTLLDQKE